MTRFPIIANAAARALADKVFTDYLYEDSGEVLNWCVQSLYRIIDYFQLSRYEEMKGIANFDIQTISNLYFITTMQSVYSEKIQRICTFLKDLKGGSNDAIVAKVMKMVKEKYADPELSLQKIASDLGISYNYLSTIFKQISGENFSSYLTKIKMNHAKQLVMEGKLKMYEIAEQIDYSSKWYYENNETIKRAVDFIISDTVRAVGSDEHLYRLYNELINKDWFMTFPDFEAYKATRDQMYADYADRMAWTKKTLINISKAGFFSSDRTIAQYNDDIWKLN